MVKQADKPSLRIRVTATAESIVRRGHPWLFAQSVKEENRPGATGELAVLFDRNDRFLAVGLYDADSPIRVRILHAGKPHPIDKQFWRSRAERAFERRAVSFTDAQTTGFRSVNGESDGWPGLVLDHYGETRVMKLYTAAWLPHLGKITPVLHDGASLVLRLSRNIQKIAHDEFGLDDGQTLNGDAVNGPVLFQENGLRFEADVTRGQKTGFFLDQRENRHAVGQLAEGRSVLNLFSYSGGFSLYAARGGAASVCSLDISEHALAAACRNFALNAHIPTVAPCPHETVQADTFDWLRKNDSRRFGLIVLDPPSMAKRESEKTDAMAAYGKLIESSIERLEKDGILVAASCSAHVPAEEFFSLARTAAKKSGRHFNELQTTQHPVDHPATFPEGHYLKCIYFRFEETT